jgi:PAS domain S-box-containing protein
MNSSIPDSSIIFGSALDVIDAGVIVVDSERLIVLWNEWMVQKSGIEAKAALGRPIAEVFSGLRTDRLAQAVSDALEFDNSGFLSHTLHPSLLPLRGSGGNPLLHNVRIRPMATNGRSYCLVQIDDVTETIRRQAVLRDRQNARYRAVVDSAHDAIVTTDESGVIQWMNNAAQRQFLFDADEAVGQPIGLFVTNAAEWPSGREQDDAARRITETSGRRKDGSVLHMEVTTSRWRSDGRVFVTGILRDTTERKLAAEALKRLNEELEQKVEERTREREEALAKLFNAQKMESIGQLTGGLAHDFNNLLAAILGNLDLLRKRLPDDAKFRRLLDGAIHGAERGASLTSRLLAFARRQELKPKAVDVAALTSGMTELLERSLGSAIQIETRIPADLPAVHVDVNQLELALLNLAVNARDAMPFGGSLAISAACDTLVAGTVPELAAGDYVRITVADTGVGMDETILAKAREPFFTTKGPGKGTGLGLSMVHGLAAQSGGALRLSSKAGQGTRVDLWLPRSAHQAKPDSNVAQPNLKLARQHCRILLVDDDALVRMGTVDMLEDLGHEVVEAGSAAEALTLLQAGAGLDMVITDQAMPGMRGTELAAQIGRKYPGLPIILATGYAELPNEEDPGLPRLSKPFRQEDIAKIIDVVIQRDKVGAKVVALRR